LETANTDGKQSTLITCGQGSAHNYPCVLSRVARGLLDSRLMASLPQNITISVKFDQQPFSRTYKLSQVFGNHPTSRSISLDLDERLPTSNIY